MGIDAKEKTARSTSVGADERQSIQKDSDNSIPDATGKRKILRKVWRKCTARCSVWPTRDTCTRSP